MRYLGLALFSEGPTDDRFLAPLLQRLCQDLCLRHARQAVDVAEEVLALVNPRGSEDASRAQRIEQAAVEAEGAWQVLFVHSDGEGDPGTVMAQRVAPGLQRIAARFAGRGVGVAVVPVRETEAWTLADGDALRAVFGTRLTDGQMGLPARARLVESVTDPKQALDAAFYATAPTGRHARAGAAALLGPLGQRVSFERLREVESFRKTEDALLAALRSLSVL